MIEIPIDPKSGELIAMPVDEARKRKFERGRAEHGPIFKLDPLLELDQEMLDSLNYCDEARNRGHNPGTLAKMRRLLYQVANLNRQMIRHDGLIHHDGTRYAVPVDADEGSGHVFCNSCGAGFAEMMSPGSQQADGCAATVTGDLLQGFYGSRAADMQVYMIVGTTVAPGNICDACINELLQRGKLVLLQDDVL